MSIKIWNWCISSVINVFISEEKLEPDAVKVARPVLRGDRIAIFFPYSNIFSLPD